MVVRRLEDFDGRVASVRSGGGFDGYLRVRLVRWRDSEIPGVDLDLVLNTDVGWQFSDRADPDPSDATDELNAGNVHWYGDHLIVQGWLSSAEADLIVAEHFALE